MFTEAPPSSNEYSAQGDKSSALARLLTTNVFISSNVFITKVFFPDGWVEIQKLQGPYRLQHLDMSQSWHVVDCAVLQAVQQIHNKCTTYWHSEVLSYMDLSSSLSVAILMISIVCFTLLTTMHLQWLLETVKQHSQNETKRSPIKHVLCKVKAWFIVQVHVNEVDCRRRELIVESRIVEAHSCLSMQHFRWYFATDRYLFRGELTSCVGSGVTSTANDGR